MDAPRPELVDARPETGMAGKPGIHVGCNNDGDVQAKALGEETEGHRIRHASGELVDGVQRGRGNEDEIGRGPGARGLGVVEADGVLREFGDCRQIRSRL